MSELKMTGYLNFQCINVDKIRSYQTLVYKNGFKSFQKQEYKDYKQELWLNGVNKLQKTNSKNLKIAINFFFKNKKTNCDLDNITKPILDLLQEKKIIINDKYINALSIHKFTNMSSNYITIKICD